MSDIVERLRNWRTVHLARLHLLMEDAADEMERLSRTGSNDAKTGDDAAECRDQSVKLPERDRLTDEEREAVSIMADIANDPRGVAKHHGLDLAATLRELLERLE